MYGVKPIKKQQQKNNYIFSFSPIEQKTAEKHIKHLKNGKATGLDGIGSRLLKAGSPVVSIYLNIIFNASASNGYVPKCWKLKRVSPIHKGDEKLTLAIIDQFLSCPYP